MPYLRNSTRSWRRQTEPVLWADITEKITEISERYHGILTPILQAQAILFHGCRKDAQYALWIPAKISRWKTYGMQSTTDFRAFLPDSF